MLNEKERFSGFYLSSSNFLYHIQNTFVLKALDDLNENQQQELHSTLKSKTQDYFLKLTIFSYMLTLIAWSAFHTFSNWCCILLLFWQELLSMHFLIVFDRNCFPYFTTMITLSLLRALLSGLLMTAWRRSFLIC